MLIVAVYFLRFVLAPLGAAALFLLAAETLRSPVRLSETSSTKAPRTRPPA